MATNQGKLPLFAFGDPVDFDNDYTAAANITVTGSQADPLGGTDGYNCNDHTAGAGVDSLSTTTAFALAPNIEGEAIVAIFVKVGSSNNDPMVSLYDSTATAHRHMVSLNFSGGVPTPATESGGGTIFPTISCGSGWYLVRFSAASIVSGNNHKIFIYPASGTASAQTGDVNVFGQSVVVMGLHIDEARAWGEPREGSEWAKAPSGFEDAWIVANDEFLEGDARWIPTTDVDAPHNRTGWDGLYEYALVNVGWHAFLEYASESLTVTFCPDRTATATNRSVYVVEPRESFDRRPDREDDDTKRLTLLLRDASDNPFIGY